MALPMNNSPVYNMTIPSTGDKVRFKPFLVKQEKALLLAMQSENEEVMIDTLKEIIGDCIIDKVNTDDLSTFDVEYIFAQLRAKSVGEVIDVLVRCDECNDDKATVKLGINIDNIAVQQTEGHDKKIELWDGVGVIMKYPNFAMVTKLRGLSEENMSPQQMFDIVVDCMQMIYDSEQTYLIKETPKQEVLDFLDNLTNDQFQKIQNFFDTMPKLSHTVEYDCPVCTKHHIRKLEGLQSFFT